MCIHTRFTKAKVVLSLFREFAQTQKNENTIPTPHCTLLPHLDLKRKKLLLCVRVVELFSFYKKSVIIASWAKQSLTLTTQNKPLPVLGKTSNLHNLCNTQFLHSSVNKSRISSCSSAVTDKGNYNTLFLHNMAFLSEREDREKA